MSGVCKGCGQPYSDYSCGTLCPPRDDLPGKDDWKFALTDIGLAVREILAAAEEIA